MQNLLSLDQAASRLGVCRSSLYNLLSAKRLTALKLGRRTLISESEIERYISGLPTAVIARRVA